MNITISQRDLQQLLSFHQGVAQDRQTALLGVKAQQNQIELLSIDSSIGVHNKITCQVDEPGLHFVPLAYLMDVVRELPDAKLKLETSEAFLHINSNDKTRLKMKIPLAQETTGWNEPPQIDDTHATTLPCADLAYMIEQVGFCVSQDNARVYGRIAYLHRVDEKTLRLVASDGYRLSYCSITVDHLGDDFLKEEGVSLSKRCLNELLRLSRQGYETVKLTVAPRSAMLNAKLGDDGQHQLYLRLSNIRYPNYRGALPTGQLYPIKLEREAMQHMLRRALLATDQNYALRLCFSPSSLTLKGENMGRSEIDEVVHLPDYKGSEAQFAVNGRYLTEIFATIKSSDLTLQVGPANSPLVLIPKQEPKACRTFHMINTIDKR